MVGWEMYEWSGGYWLSGRASALCGWCQRLPMYRLMEDHAALPWAPSLPLVVLLQRLVEHVHERGGQPVGVQPLGQRH